MIQLDLFEKTLQEQFDDWVHSPEGGAAANRFIRMAIGLKRRRMKVGAKAIWERLRWNYMIRNPKNEQYALNNNYTAYMARFAMQRAPELQGYFNVRSLSSCHQTRPRRAVVIPIR